MITTNQCKYDGKINLPDGRQIEVSFPYDMDHGAPWDEMDGIGVVRPLHRYFNREELEEDGSRVMFSRHDAWLYDWPATREKAIAEGWGPDIETAMEADHKFCAGYLSEQWCYVVVSVRLLDADGEEISADYLGGVESLGEYYAEEAACMANDLIEQDDKERAESSYWLEREVITA